MITRANVTRRIFLRTLVCLSALGLTRPARGLAKLDEASAPNPLASNLAMFFTHKESAAKVGLEYLRSVPEEADANRLVDLICSSQSEGRANLVEADLERLRELLRRQHLQDFEHGRVVKLHGWILSETEVRLCGLAAII